MLIVSIDPGHGGSDTGAVRGGVQEKDVVLQVARLVRTLSQTWSVGLEVRLTRDFDKNLGLEEAGQLSKGAHVVVALHADAAAGPSPQGMWAAYMPDSTHAKASEVVAQALTDSAPGELLRRSGAVVQATDLPGAEDDWLGRARNVLRPHNHAPAVLIEAGFLTNDGDRAFLASEAGRRELAVAIIHGLCRARWTLGLA